MTKHYPVEQRERAVKMVLDRLDEYRSVYAACQVIGPKVGGVDPDGWSASARGSNASPWQRPVLQRCAPRARPFVVGGATSARWIPRRPRCPERASPNGPDEAGRYCVPSVTSLSNGLVGQGMSRRAIALPVDRDRCLEPIHKLQALLENRRSQRWPSSNGLRPLIGPFV
jgi:hypothetical protein